MSAVRPTVMAKICSCPCAYAHNVKIHGGSGDKTP
jgi:hypothetical protein